MGYSDYRRRNSSRRLSRLERKKVKVVVWGIVLAILAAVAVIVTVKFLSSPPSRPDTGPAIYT